MRARFRHLVFGALAGVLVIAAAPAFAQANRPLEPPKGPPPPARSDKSHNIDFLFQALKAAPDETTAKAIADRIWSLWLASGGDTTNLLMSRVRTAIEAKELDLAVQLLDSVIEFKPEYIEGWDQRATVYFLKKDFERALEVYRRALAIDPHMQRVPDLVKTLSEKVEGRDI